MDALRKRVGTDLLFHAAGLADEAGRVVVLVAPSGMGKTTAARTLGTTLGYVSDESVAIRRDGTVGAYPKPLSLVKGENRTRKIEVSPREAGLRRHPDTLVFSRLVLLVRDPDHQGPPVVEEMDLLDAAVQAAAQTSGLAKLEAPLDWLARSLTTGGDPVTVKYREIYDGASLIHDLLAETSPKTVTWTHHATSGGFPPKPGGWARNPYVDAIESSGRALVLTEQGVVLLDGIGALVWLAAERSVTKEAFLERALVTLGPHPDAKEILDGALTQLVKLGLLSTA
ncbi:MAG: hypothetical protein Q4P15_12490 [Propionibacteriaceae bacterium]|nr:hypothetical protein [Propionibacteriaceae bacterium]